jgi:hypothetical protein
MWYPKSKLDFAHEYSTSAQCCSLRCSNWVTWCCAGAAPFWLCSGGSHHLQPHLYTLKWRFQYFICIHVWWTFGARAVTVFNLPPVTLTSKDSEFCSQRAFTERGHNLGGYVLNSYNEASGSIPGNFVWDSRDGKSDPGAGFISSFFGFPLLLIIPPLLHIHAYESPDHAAHCHILAPHLPCILPTSLHSTLWWRIHIDLSKLATRKCDVLCQSAPLPPVTCPPVCTLSSGCSSWHSLQIHRVYVKYSVTVRAGWAIRILEVLGSNIGRNRTNRHQVSRDILNSFPVSVGTVPPLGHTSFLPNPFQFIIHYHPIIGRYIV